MVARQNRGIKVLRRDRRQRSSLPQCRHVAGSREAHGRAEFPGFGLLFAFYCERALENDNIENE